jgi:hypothetical protein
MPANTFAFPLRVVDTFNMCIVNLAEDDRYIALSYVWGDVETVKLEKNNEALLRIPGALDNLSNIPQTL